MADKEHDLDDLFRSKLKGLEADPLSSSWDKIHSTLGTPQPAPVKAPSFVHKYWMVAALSMVVLTAIWVSYQAFSTTQLSQEHSSVVQQDPGQGRDGKLSAADTNISQEQQIKNSELQPLQSVKGLVYTATDTLKKVTLVDGTVVTLQKNATLVLDPHFPDTRIVNLQGKAFFEVPKATHPFEVTTAQTQLRLQEGVFVFATKPEVQLFVKSGAVQFKANKVEHKVNSGEKVSVVKNQLSNVAPITSPNYLSWQTGKLVFDNTQLDQVVSDIESYYGMGISLESEGLKNCRFTGVFEKSSLDEVLQVLSVSFDLKYNQKASRYTLQGAGCK